MYSVYNANYFPYTIQYCTLHTISNTVQCTFYRFMLYLRECTVYNVHSADVCYTCENVRCTMYILQMYVIPARMYGVQCIFYRCMLYLRECTVYNVHSTDVCYTCENVRCTNRRACFACTARAKPTKHIFRCNAVIEPFVHVVLKVIKLKRFKRVKTYQL